jgi:hypothetical protein
MESRRGSNQRMRPEGARKPTISNRWFSGNFSLALTPGHELHETRRGGNRILRHVFDLLHAEANQRSLIPPFFIFKKYPTPSSARSVQFKGLAAPGFPAASDLVAVWKTTSGQRFQNYRAVLTVLNVPVIPRAWINDISGGHTVCSNTPQAWTDWVQTGVRDLWGPHAPGATYRLRMLVTGG